MLLTWEVNVWCQHRWCLNRSEGMCAIHSVLLLQRSKVGERESEWKWSVAREWQKTLKNPSIHRYRKKYLSFGWLLWHSLILISLSAWLLSPFTLNKDENGRQLSRQQTVSIACIVSGCLVLIFPLSTSCMSDICLAVAPTFWCFSACALPAQPATAMEMMFSRVTVAGF